MRLRYTAVTFLMVTSKLGAEVRICSPKEMLENCRKGKIRGHNQKTMDPVCVLGVTAVLGLVQARVNSFVKIIPVELQFWLSGERVITKLSHL